MPAISQSNRPPAALTHVGYDDAVPTTFIKHILSLPSPAGCNDNQCDDPEFPEPSLKRRKIGASSATSSICIARSEVSFSRPCEDDGPDDFEKLCQDVGKHLYFIVRDGQLSICTRSNSLKQQMDIWFSVHDEEIDQNAGKILWTSSNTKRRSTSGAIWSNVDLFLKKHGSVVSLKLSLKAFWNETYSPFSKFGNSQQRQVSEEMIRNLFPNPTRNGHESWSPMDFYEAAHVPCKNDEAAQSIYVPRLEATLFPYQKRSLQWLLRREGVTWEASPPGIRPLFESETVSDLDTFRSIRDANGCEVYLSDVFQTITTDTSAYHEVGRALKGGILAEEMGLGKTLEMISLILLHQRPPTASMLSLPQFHQNLVPSGATLIVTPISLRPQWLSELSRHAPGLRVKDYTGRKTLKEEDEVAITNDLAAYDVVITTYNVLSADLHFAIAPPERSRRYARVYQRKNSPLVQISWWRVCLDEAQMIESGVSQAAALAKLIPRVNAWGITGTPVKDDVKDLRGLLSFLHYEPFCSVSEVWTALTTHHKPLFRQLFNSISLRHTKILVRDEIMLPPQKRYVINMPFTAVEEQHYQTMFKEMAEACDVDLGGAPLVHDWNSGNYEDVMRLWLNRLRQTTLHPEVGVYGRRVLGNSKERPMRTVEEVLNAMLEQSEITIRTDERAYLASKLFLGQLFENGPRVKEALAIWEKARDEAKNLVSEAKAKLHQALGEQAGKRDSRHPDGEIPEEIEDTSSSDDESGVDSGAESRGKGRHGEAQSRLREALELHHKAIFFCANAYFQIRGSQEKTEPESPEHLELKKLEDKGYEDARIVRRQILQQSHRKATKLMDRIIHKAKEQSFMEIPELVISGAGGLESDQVVHDLKLLYDELNIQANIIDQWREQAIQLLLKPLVDGEEDIETTGEELADSTTVQEELMVHVQALRAIVTDRHEAVSGQVNELIRHETKTSIRMAKNGEGPAPEKLIALLTCKDEVKPKNPKRSLRGVISELRSINSRLGGAKNSLRETLEAKIVNDLLKKTQKVLAEQSKAVISLEAEIDGFKHVMNARVEYYRQLQAVSDGVLPYEGLINEIVVARARKAVDDADRRLLSDQAKHRYLLHIKETGSRSNEPRMCVICQMPFITGVLTVCGHQFCKECMMMWFKAHHNCPVCKKALKADNLHDIIIKPQELQVRSEQSIRQGDSQPRTQSAHLKNTMIYSEFNAEKLEEMKNIELDGPSFTTKVDTLVRHLLWLRESDPGAKSIVFSQYRDFLAVLQNAFRRFRIGFASIDDAKGITKFKEDAGVECFLLHARAHSSGLNLVNASHVFLCEPLLNTALELQAIARVDRIGQQHETTVWLYIVSGTVEESIYNLSVRRRMEHMGRNLKSKSKESTPELLDASIEAANTLELEHAALSKLMSRDQSAGEMVNHNDLWECLFGHVVAGEASKNKGPPPHQQASSLQERAVMSYLTGEAAEARRDERN